MMMPGVGFLMKRGSLLNRLFQWRANDIVTWLLHQKTGAQLYNQSTSGRTDGALPPCYITPFPTQHTKRDAGGDALLLLASFFFFLVVAHIVSQSSAVGGCKLCCNILHLGPGRFYYPRRLLRRPLRLIQSAQKLVLLAKRLSQPRDDIVGCDSFAISSCRRREKLPKFPANDK